ncbi:MAG: DNA alkylation repair protein [Deferribacteraceae bacterium]|jgi:3-methyladenine DNA glycosylase AlkD|nr:DNA alkylation repair protein [Deferribacteraceae bacterium]
MNHSEILEILIREQDPKKAASSLRFFKTGRGEYGEGDKFLGFTVADIRGLVKRYGKELTLTDLEELLKSEWHEARHFALLVMVKRAAGELEAVYDLFIRNVERVNNWDIVDISSPYISGAYWYKSGDCTT